MQHRQMTKVELTLQELQVLETLRGNLLPDWATMDHVTLDEACRRVQVAAQLGDPQSEAYTNNIRQTIYQFGLYAWQVGYRLGIPVTYTTGLPKKLSPAPAPSGRKILPEGYITISYAAPHGANSEAFTAQFPTEVAAQHQFDAWQSQYHFREIMSDNMSRYNIELTVQDDQGETYVRREMAMPEVAYYRLCKHLSFNTNATRL